MIKVLERFDLRPSNLRQGAPYRSAEAQSPAPLALKVAGPDGATFVAEMDVDPDAVRRSRAEADIAVGEIIKAPLTLDEALRKRADDTISGAISVIFDTDSHGHVRRKTTITKLKINRSGGQFETTTSTEVVERRLLSGR